MRCHCFVLFFIIECKSVFHKYPQQYSEILLTSLHPVVHRVDVSKHFQSYVERDPPGKVACAFSECSRPLHSACFFCFFLYFFLEIWENQATPPHVDT